MRSATVNCLGLFLILQPLAGREAVAQRWPVRVLKRLIAPFRSDPFAQSKVSHCAFGLANCFLPSTVSARPENEFSLTDADSAEPLILEVRADHGGVLGHQWIELKSESGEMTIGFGPATLPFIDAGEVSLRDRYGNTKWISGMHPLPVLALPPIRYRYARGPGEGHPVRKPVMLTAAQSRVLVHKLQGLKFVGPYIPIFHDCHTFTCSIVASAEGRSTLPCYLLFKGHW